MLPRMSSFTFTSVADVWPVGMSVSAYAPGTSIPSGTSGSALATAAVASDGSLTFTGLADDTAYVATDGSRTRRFRTSPVVVGTSSATNAPIPVGDFRSIPYRLSNLSDGVQTGQNVRWRHVAQVSSRDLRLEFGNYYTVNGVETDGLNAITVRAAIETADGQFIPLYFNGSRDVTIQPGTGIVRCDPTGFDVTKGDVFYERVFITVTSGQKWPNNRLQYYTGEGQTIGTTETDKTTTAATTAGVSSASFAKAYGACSIVGTPQTATRSVLGAISDSIGAGTGEALINTDMGWIVRGVASTVAFQHLGWPSDLAANWTPTSLATARRRRSMMREWTDCIFAEGTNDLGTTFAAGDAAALEAKLITATTMLYARGIKVRVCTMPPRTTSTDGWITVANQTATASDPSRVAVNTWLRDGAPIDATSKAVVAAGTNTNVLRAGSVGHPIYAILEVADTVESARNSGKWAVPAGQRAVTDAAITSGAAILTSATANFTDADLGRGVCIAGAGAAGALLLAQIRSRQSATQVTLHSSAGTTVTGATATIGVMTNDGLHPAQDGHVLMSTLAAGVAAQLTASV